MCSNLLGLDSIQAGGARFDAHGPQKTQEIAEDVKREECHAFLKFRRMVPLQPEQIRKHGSRIWKQR